MRRITLIEGPGFGDEAVQRRPSMPSSTLEPYEALAQFLAALDRSIDQDRLAAAKESHEDEILRENDEEQQPISSPPPR